MKNLVSIIIPTYNSEKTLGKCLESIKKQTFTDFEIIVVDNNSKDTTKEIAKKYTENVFNKGPERTAQKNFGIERAKGKYMLFIDGDMLLDKEVLGDCIKQIKISKKGGGVVLPVIDVGKSFWTKVIAFERSFYKGSSMEAARFLDSSLVKKVGGFKNIIFYEEFIVPQEISKLGYNVKNYTKYNIYHDYDDFTFIGNLKKKYYYGKSFDKYKKQMKKFGLEEEQSNQTGILGRYMIFLKQKRFYTKPCLALGVLSLKTCEFGAGAFGILFSKFKK